MTHFSRLICFGFIFLFLLLPLPSRAQWSNDPLQNLAIADTTGEQVLPKIAPTSDGGCYISWFDTRNGNYSVYLQRLNSLGVPQWQQNGLLVSNHPQQSWITDYDMTVDNNDNAIIVFSDIRNGGNSNLDVFAYKIAPDGTFLWGADGIGLSDSTASDFEPSPKVTATSAGNAVVAWLKSGTRDLIGLQKISEAGNKMWGDFGITLPVTGDQRLSSPDVVPALNDSVIAVWKNSTGPFWAPTTRLYTQKFAPDGTTAWDSAGVLIYDLGNISAWTDPQIYPDAHGGAFYTYYDSPSLSQFNVWVQHVSAHGTLLFPVNGVQASTNSNDRLHSEPTLSYLHLSDELYVFWLEKNGNQNRWGVFGQKFSPAGNRLWTDSGKQFVPVNNLEISFVRSIPADTSIYISYFQAPTPSTMNDAVKTFRIDRNGNLFFSPTVLSDASLGEKGRLQLTVNSENRAFLTWSDKRSDAGDIYAQNVNPDGTLGNPPNTVSASNMLFPERFRLYQNYPNPFNPFTIIDYSIGKRGMVTLKIFNSLGQKVRTLVASMQEVGMKSVTWNGLDDTGTPVSSGLYFYRLQFNNKVLSRKMLLLR